MQSAPCELDEYPLGKHSYVTFSTKNDANLTQNILNSLKPVKTVILGRLKTLKIVLHLHLESKISKFILMFSGFLCVQ